MKRMKKLLAVLMAVVMVMSLGSVSAMAEGETTYTITVKSSLANRTYKAYQLFAGDMSGTSLINVTAGTGIDIWDNVAGYPTEDATKIADLTKAMTDSSEVIDSDKTGYSTLGALFTAQLSSDASAAAIANVVATYGQMDESVLVAFAKEVARFTLTSAEISVKTTTESGTTYSYSFTDLDAGYYLIVDETDVSGNNDASSRYMLVLTSDNDNYTVTIDSKEEVPTLEKTLKDGSASTSATVGDELSYVITTSIPDTTGYSSYTYIITDELSAGLELVTSGTGDHESGYDPLDITIKVGSGSALNGIRISGTSSIVTTSSYDYYYYTTANSNGTTTLTIVFTNFLTLTADASTKDKITTAYTAKLTEDAEIGSDGNPNTAKLTYSNNPNANTTSDTTEQKVTVYTYEMDFTKVDSASITNTLSGAEFYLTDEDDNYAVATATFTQSADETEAGATTIENTYTITGWTTSKDGATKMITGSDGVIKVKGLGTGTFYLYEETAPSGYVEWTDPATIVISAVTDSASTQSLSATIDTTNNYTGTFSSGIITATITNNSSSAIPSTGGIGTTIFYVVGAILVVGAAVLLITRRRMASR